MHRALLLVSFVAACSSEDRRLGPTQDVTPPMLTAATQQDLATELDLAESRGTWSEVKRRWQGQTLTWKVTRQALLCRSADECFVAAFPIQRPAKRGWMPQLVFAPGQYEVVAAACGDQPRCEITVEGLLEKLDVSAQMPTNLKFSNVRIVTRTAAR